MRSIALGHALGGGLTQARHARHLRVAQVVGVDVSLDGVLDRVGDGEVHLGDPQRQHVVRVAPPLGALARP